MTGRSVAESCLQRYLTGRKFTLPAGRPPAVELLLVGHDGAHLRALSSISSPDTSTTTFSSPPVKAKGAA